MIEYTQALDTLLFIFYMVCHCLCHLILRCLLFIIKCVGNRVVDIEETRDALIDSVVSIVGTGLDG